MKALLSTSWVGASRAADSSVGVLSLVRDHDPAVLALLPDGDLGVRERRVSEGADGDRDQVLRIAAGMEDGGAAFRQKLNRRISASSSEWRMNCFERPLMAMLCAGKRAW